MNRSNPPSLARRTDGAVYVEYLVAGVPLFIMFLTTVQLCLIAMAGLVVKHAAWTAARAAMVVLVDSNGDTAGVNGAGCNEDNGKKGESSRRVGYGLAPRWVPGADVNAVLSRDSARAYDNCFDSLHSWMKSAAEGGVIREYDQNSKPGNVRAQNIVAAAVSKTAAISPLLNEWKGLSGNSVKSAFVGNSSELGDGQFNHSRPLSQKTNYAKAATGVRISVTNNEVVTTVAYQFACNIPVADLVVCGTRCDNGFDSNPEFYTIDRSSKVCDRQSALFRFLTATASAPLPAKPLWVPGEYYAP